MLYFMDFDIYAEFSTYKSRLGYFEFHFFYAHLT